MAVGALLRVQHDVDVARASQVCRAETVRLGWTPRGQATVDLVVRELAWNLVRHAGGGDLALKEAVHPATPQQRGVCVESIDRGPGIGVLGHPKPSSLGIGLDTVQRLSDDFTLVTRPGATRVRAVLWWR